MSPKNPIKYVAAGVAAVVLAFGAYAVGNSNTGHGTSGTASASQSAPAGQTPQSGQTPQGGRLPRNGQAPPGFGTPVTGATADKVKAAALAKYPGTVERVMKLADGSYVAHVITSGGERYVAVSKSFTVTGSQQGGPRGGGPPSGAAPPSSGSSSSGTSS